VENGREAAFAAQKATLMCEHQFFAFMKRRLDSTAIAPRIALAAESPGARAGRAAG
jgi:hypothetical protein